MSEDGRIFIYSDDEGNTSGYFKFGNETIPVDFYFEMTGSIDISTHPTDTGFTVPLGGFYRTGFYYSGSFTMSTQSKSLAYSPVVAYKDKIRFKKLDKNQMIAFDINEYLDKPVMKNSETIFSITDDMYSDIYKDYERDAHSSLDSLIAALELAEKGCNTTVVNVDAHADSDILTVRCTDEAGTVFEIRCDRSQHIIID